MFIHKGEILVSRSLTRLQAILLGLVVLAGLGLAVGGLFTVGSKYWPWNSTFEIRVPFPRAVELGTRVRVQGIDAGEVVKIEPPAKPGGSVMMTLRLEGKWKQQQLIRKNAVAKIVSEGMVGSKYLEIHPGTEAADPITDNAEIQSEAPPPDLADALGKVGELVEAFKNEKGRVTGLVDNTNTLITQGQGTMKSIQRVAEAVEEMPIVKNYVKNPEALLIRPDCERNQWVFPEGNLFDKDSARLTTDGRKKLDDLAKRVNELKHDGSEVVVVAYADPKTNPTYAAHLTRQQSLEVANYLKDRHSVHKTGWFSTRPVTALGLGVELAPHEPGRDANPPPSRVEVLVFVPQKR